ncbi:glutathione S-transferase N-terminal domain-containing protein [Salinisphaera sp. SPP-AMP-43]|uniref:glutathione S-transferase N-terminal domain-containing protein n=1 Tax=Salinisphaera sp. SPP-AMP-43 TaxID=3121288 RepID=UPI003C6DCAE9
MIENMLHLYEYEGCPFCRGVRQALAALSLDSIVFPCPRGGRRFRPQAEAVGGRQQFPLLVDTATNTVQYESRDIIGYLQNRYAEAALAPPGIGELGAAAETELAGLSGMQLPGASGRRPPARLFELYNDEASAPAYQIRALLGLLELPYILRSPAVLAQIGELPGWVRRAAPEALDAAHPPAPTLIDPNTQTALFDAGSIAAYLQEHY